jgi:hypothetical protein
LRVFTGDITKTKIKVANKISAELTRPPDMLQIILRGDKMRTVASTTRTTWVLDVKPLKPGEATVILQVISYIKLGKEEKPFEIRVMQEQWTVQARGLEWLKYQISEIEPVQSFMWTIAAGFVAVLGYFGFQGFRRKLDDNNDPTFRRKPDDDNDLTTWV